MTCNDLHVKCIHKKDITVRRFVSIHKMDAKLELKNNLRQLQIIANATNHIKKDILSTVQFLAQSVFFWIHGNFRLHETVWIFRLNLWYPCQSTCCKFQNQHSKRDSGMLQTLVFPKIESPAWIPMPSHRWWSCQISQSIVLMKCSLTDASFSESR